MEKLIVPAILYLTANIGVTVALFGELKRNRLSDTLAKSSLFEFYFFFPAVLFAVLAQSFYKRKS